ncbi:MAG: hypothetical protein R3F43_14175 [bacterium]
MKRATWMAAAALVATAGFARADDLIVLEGGPRGLPEEYVVERGDTLWDICERFFRALAPGRASGPSTARHQPHWITPGTCCGCGCPTVPAWPRRRWATPWARSRPYGSASTRASSKRKLESAGTVVSSGTQAVSGRARQGLPEPEEAGRGPRGRSLQRLPGGQRRGPPRDGGGHRPQGAGARRGRDHRHRQAGGHREHPALLQRDRARHVRGAGAGPLHVVSPRQNLIDLTSTIVDSLFPRSTAWASSTWSSSIAAPRMACGSATASS